MRILGIETSTTVISVAVGNNQQILGEVAFSTKQAHMEYVLPMIDYLLKNVGFTLEDLDGFAVASGPGSFTSLRVGLATGKALAHALGKPIVEVPTLDVLAVGLKGVSGLICPVLRARSQEVYAAFYVSTHTGVKRLSSYLALDSTALALCLEENLRTSITFVGEGAQYYWEMFKEKLGKWAFLADSPQMWPRAGFVVALGWSLLGTGGGKKPGSIQALYVRPPTVQHS